jgi:predicted  nucleic acid-binding Zn-ribbon protein
MTVQTARSQLTSFTARYQDMQDRIIQLEAMSHEAGRTAEDIENLQREVRTLKAEAARLENQRSSLLMAEVEAARQHAEEQARMDALHAEIEELGRTLLAPTRQ